MIKTIEELAALPEETPIRDVKGFVWESAGLATEHAAEYGDSSVLPATLLIPATINRDQAIDVANAYWHHPGNRLDAMTAALAVLGIEVSDE